MLARNVTFCYRSPRHTSDAPLAHAERGPLPSDGFSRGRLIERDEVQAQGHCADQCP